MLYKHIHKDRVNSLMTISAAVIIAARLNATNWNNTKILAKKNINCNYRSKSRQKQAKTVLQLCRSPAHLQRSSSQLIQLLLLLPFLFLFTQILGRLSSPRVPDGPLPPTLLSPQPLQAESKLVVCSVKELRYLGVSKKYI